MMLYPAMNKLTAYVPNRYMLVNVVARRARQIADAAEEAGEHLVEKPVTMAIHEVAEGKLDARAMDLTIEEPADQI
jgi:DNA-directed RNA polymerase subunit omega